MAENRGNLTSYRPDIKVMDCTLRDGGLVNNFEFTDEFVKDLYEAPLTRLPLSSKSSAL